MATVQRYLSTTKSLLANGSLDNTEAIYVVTPSNPSFDQLISTIVFAYLESSISSDGTRYVPVVLSLRDTTLTRDLPSLPVALQACGIDPETLIFKDDQEWKKVNTYTSRKNVVLVGASSQISSVQALNEWCDLYRFHPIRVVDTETDLWIQADMDLQKSITPSRTKTLGSAAEVEPSLASLVTLEFRQVLEKQTEMGSLASLLLASILLETDNLAESRSTPTDLSAVGFLSPRSLFRYEGGDNVTRSAISSSSVAESQPDFDSFYQSLKSAMTKDVTLSTIKGSLDSASATISQASGSIPSPPDHFQWNLINGTLPRSMSTDKANDDSTSIPNFVKKTIQGEFSDLLRSPVASTLLQPIATVLGRVASQGTLSPTTEFDLAKRSIYDAVVSVFDSESTSPSTSSPSTTMGYQLLCIAISALHAFVQVNWTGPDLASDLTPYHLLRSSAANSFPQRTVNLDSDDGDDNEEQSIGRIIHRSSLESLVLKGEPAYHLCQAPFFLVFSKMILEALWKYSQQKRLPIESLAWWRLRAFTVHSHILDEAVAPGKKVFDPVAELLDLLNARVKAFDSATSQQNLQPKQQDEIKRNPWAALTARLILERGIALQRQGNDREASERFVEAAQINGLRYQLSGALGKKTKFQKEDKTQLVLLAKSLFDDQEPEQQQQQQENKTDDEAKPEREDQGDTKEQPAKDDAGWQAQINPEEQVTGMPSTYALNDDVLLEQTRFTSTSKSGSGGSVADEGSDLLSLDPNQQPPLAILDQCTMLAMCLNIRNTQPSHGLTSNQMMSFIARVISHPRNWMVHTMSLLLRARLESNRTRTVERSVLQLQALIDQMSCSDSLVQERLLFFHALDLPAKWEMQAELASRYASIGVTRSALEIYQRIEMWEEVVHCLGMLGRQVEGIEVIRDLLQGKKVEAEVDVSRRRRLGVTVNDSTAQQVMFGRLDRARESKLWCLLGDLEPEQALDHYTQAWQVSRSSSARAARSLGGYHFAKDQHADAAEWLRAALKINPLYTRSWFVLGCSYMRLENWTDAAGCFRRCTSLDEEDGEAWNNLASCYLRMDQESDAVSVERDVRNPELLYRPNRSFSLSSDTDEDEDEDEEEEDWSEREDSGVELSSTDGENDSESEAELVESNRPDSVPSTATTGGSRYNLKLLAHRSLSKSLKYSHDNWRVWYNYMIVSIDVGYFAEACRAMSQSFNLQTRSSSLTESVKESKIDFIALSKLIDAVIQHPFQEEETKPNPNYGIGLFKLHLLGLFQETFLTKISNSSTIWNFYAKLMFWSKNHQKIIDACINEYRCIIDTEPDWIEKSFWIQAIAKLENLVTVLLDYVSNHIDQEEKKKEIQFQIKSMVRSFLGKSRSLWSQESEFEELKQVLDKL